MPIKPCSTDPSLTGISSRASPVSSMCWPRNGGARCSSAWASADAPGGRRSPPPPPGTDGGPTSERPTPEPPPPLKLLCPLFFFKDPAATEIYTLSLHDALPIYANQAMLDRSVVDRDLLESVAGLVDVLAAEWRRPLQQRLGVR